MPGTRVTIEIELVDVPPSEVASIRSHVATILGLLPAKLRGRVTEIGGPVKRLKSPTALVLDDNYEFDIAGGWRFRSQVLEIVRHKARGGLYDVLGKGKLQASAPVHDEANLVAYRDRVTGEFYFRPPSEMVDGRFEGVPYAR